MRQDPARSKVMPQYKSTFLRTPITHLSFSAISQRVTFWEGSREQWLNKSIYSVSFDISKEACTDPMAIEVNPFEGKDPRDHPTCTHYAPVTKNPWQISSLECPYWNPDPFFAGDSQGLSALNVSANASAKIE